MISTPSAHALLITGNEPVEALRNQISKLAYRCPFGSAHAKCPFRLFGLLDFNVRENMVKTMTRESCVHCFELEQECRTEIAAKKNAQ
ncbi:MAG: hypothetical protein IPP19_10945 [Verrucomicrobia bacterium]|nr:hypothetical protein [Verrucomicrobiota bacterium]